MRRMVLGTVVAVILSLGTAPAYADKENKPCRGEDSCQSRGDCYQAEKPCEDNDFSFQDSPVDRSFNPVICLPMSTCNVDRNEGGGDGTGPGGSEGSGEPTD